MHKSDANAIARLEHDPNVDWTAESYYMMKVKYELKMQSKTKLVTVLKQWGKLISMKI